MLKPLFRSPNPTPSTLPMTSSMWVYRMVGFLYRGDYQELDHPDYQMIDQDLLDRSGPHHAVLHAAMFATADKYNIAILGDVAKTSLSSRKPSTCSSSTAPHFLEVVEYIYSTTPEFNRGLRDVVVFQTQTCSSKIMTTPVLNSRLEQIASTSPQFAWDLIRKSLLPASLKRYSVRKAELGDRISCSECLKKGRGTLFPESHKPNATSLFARYGPFPRPQH